MHSVIFSKTLFDFKKSISGPIELKISGKTLNSVSGSAYPAGFGSLKAVTNCFWPRKVGHINGLFVLEDESGGWQHFETSKKSNKWKNGMPSITLLKVLPMANSVFSENLCLYIFHTL